MTVNGEVFQTGSVKVPLISNATLLDARSTDRPLPLVAEGNAHVAVVTGPAAFSATLEWGTSITSSPGRGSFVLPVPPAGSVTATFDVPGEQSDLRVTPGLVLRRTSAGGRTTVEATLDPGSSTQVWWSSRDTGPAAPPRDSAAAVRRQDPRHHRRCRSAPPLTRRHHRRPGRTDGVRGPHSHRLRARRRDRQFARSQRTARSATGSRRLGAIAKTAPVPDQSRTSERRRILHARDRLPDGARCTARNRRSRHRGTRHAGDFSPWIRRTPPDGRARSRSGADLGRAPVLALRIPLPALGGGGADARAQRHALP